MSRKYLAKAISFLGSVFCIISFLGLIAWMQASDPDCLLVHTGAFLEQRLCASEYSGENLQPSYIYLVAIAGIFIAGLFLYGFGSRIDKNEP